MSTQNNPQNDDLHAAFITPRGRYRIKKEISQGQYGRVYLARSPITRKKVAIKLAKRSNDWTLKQEIEVLKKARRAKCTPTFYDCGQIDDGRRFIAMELLGWDLFKIRTSFDPPRFSWRTILFIAQETLKGLRHLHELGFVVNDFKLGNVAISEPSSRTLKIFDFGLARKYKDEYGRHKKERVTPLMISTPRYASLRLHGCVSGSRKDDMEVWFYNMAECLVPLPWEKSRDHAEIIKGKEDFHKLAYSEYLQDYPYMYASLLMEILGTPQFGAPNYDELAMIIQKRVEKLSFPDVKLDWENE